MLSWEINGRCGRGSSHNCTAEIEMMDQPTPATTRRLQQDGCRPGTTGRKEGGRGRRRREKEIVKEGWGGREGGESEEKIDRCLPPPPPPRTGLLRRRARSRITASPTLSAGAIPGKKEVS